MEHISINEQSIDLKFLTIWHRLLMFFGWKTLWITYNLRNGVGYYFNNFPADEIPLVMLNVKWSWRFLVFKCLHNEKFTSDLKEPLARKCR